VTNTTANIVLSNTTLDFDSTKANLLQIEGNDSNSWGTAGSNGGTVTFTAYGETLEGNISVDTISSLDAYFLDGTTYTGITTITTNATNTSVTESPITINIDSNSKWVVTDDCTVSNLNVEDGGQVVDSDGKTVTIVANGKTVVQGDSSITVTVTGSYSTSVTTSNANELTTTYIDRTNFDSTYNLSTTFTTNGSTTSPTTTTVETTSSTDDSNEKVEASSTNYVPYIIGGCIVIVALAGVLILKKKK